MFSDQALSGGSELCVLAAAVRRWSLDGAGVRQFIEALKMGLTEPCAAVIEAVAAIPDDAEPAEIFEYLQRRASTLLGQGLVPDTEESE